MSSIREALAEDMKAAMRAKETLRLSTIRMARAEILNKDKESGEETSQKDILKLMQSMVKKREEAAEQYAAAGREDLAQKNAMKFGSSRAISPRRWRMRKSKPPPRR